MPKWYDDAKIRLSTDWGVYSLPAWAPAKMGFLLPNGMANECMIKDNPTYSYHLTNYGGQLNK